MSFGMYVCMYDLLLQGAAELGGIWTDGNSPFAFRVWHTTTIIDFSTSMFWGIKWFHCCGFDIQKYLND